MNNVKSATTAGLLGLFLGAFGAHCWYLGDKKKGIIHVSLFGGAVVLMLLADLILPMFLSYRTVYTLAGLFLLLNGIAGLVMSANGIWGFVEGIMILVQGDAGLARKGYAVAGNNPNFGYSQQYNNGYNQPTQNSQTMNNDQYGQVSGQMNSNQGNMGGR